jgi:hypothetical protein
MIGNSSFDQIHVDSQILNCICDLEGVFLDAALQHWNVSAPDCDEIQKKYCPSHFIFLSDRSGAFARYHSSNYVKTLQHCEQENTFWGYEVNANKLSSIGVQVNNRQSQV